MAGTSAERMMVKWGEGRWRNEFRMYQSRAMIRVPISYYIETTETAVTSSEEGREEQMKDGSMIIRVDRYTTKIPSDDGGKSAKSCFVNNLIMLAGGPGQPIEIWQDDLAKIRHLYEASLQDETAIYLIEHRGVGQSTSPFKQQEWRTENGKESNRRVGERLSELGLKGSSFSTEHVAMDVGNFALDLLHEAVQLGIQPKIALLGVSYGGMVAARCISLFPNIFDWLIMDSPSMILGRFEQSNDEYFWQNCLDHPICRRKSGTIDNLRNIYSSLMDGKVKNCCTEATVFGVNCKTVMEELKRENVTAEIKSTRIRPSMLLVPFMLNAYHCKDPTYFAQEMLPSTLRLIIGSKQSSKLRESLKSPGNKKQINSFINNLICCSEIFRFAQAPMPPECHAKAAGLCDQCGLYRAYQIRAFRHLHEHIYSVPEEMIEDEKIGIPLYSERTRVLVLLGHMDLITPPGPILNWFNTIDVPQKILVPFRNLNHGLFPDAPATEFVLPIVFASNPDNRALLIKRLKRRIKDINRRTLNWSFSKEEYSFAKRWWDQLDDHID